MASVLSPAVLFVYLRHSYIMYTLSHIARLFFGFSLWWQACKISHVQFMQCIYRLFPVEYLHTTLASYSVEVVQGQVSYSQELWTHELTHLWDEAITFLSMKFSSYTYGFSFLSNHKNCIHEVQYAYSKYQATEVCMN